jgi:hypothetical protein
LKYPEVLLKSHSAKRMTDFEIILDHLGPSAAPLMSFLHKVEASRLLLTNKNVAEKVLAHARRWGFKPSPYVEHPDGSFTITTKDGSSRFRALKRFERLGSRRISRYRLALRPDLTHEIVLVGLYHWDPTILLTGSKEDIRAVFREAKPYIVSRAARIEQEKKQEATEKAKQEAEAKATAEREAWLAKNTTKISKLGPPTYPWGKKPAHR